MRKQVLLLVIIVLFSVSELFAQASGNVEDDSWVDGSLTNHNASGQLRIISTNGGVSCVAAAGAMVQKDVSGASGPTAGTATLDVVINNNALAVGSATLELFQADADFNETTVGGPLASRTGPSLGSTVMLNNTTPNGTTLTFPSTAAFVTYVQNAIDGDGLASFVIRMSSCALGASILDLDERETGTAAVLNLQSPTAVQVHNTKTASSPNGIVSSFIFVAALLGVITIIRNVKRT